MATVQVKLAGVDVTSLVVFSTASFDSAVNGVGGEAHLRIRDLNRSLTITPGALLELIIDGDPVWTGFALKPKRIYVFPAINVTDFGLARFFDVDAVDINVLFDRRIVAHYTGDLTDTSPLYGPNTADTDVLADLFSDWLDLSGDGIDTSSGVVGVGDINEDQNARGFFPGDTWNRAMGAIAALPGSIYYIRPNKVLAYVDDDTPTAAFGLSDRPNGSTTKGYSNMDVLFDGTNLANDVLALGAGYGNNKPVASRLIDSTSVSDHGLWQQGSTTYGVYKQDTIDRIADAIVNGSPDHHRGAKDDRIAITLTTYESGLLPADKVPFESQVFGYSVTMPIRKMVVTFPGPDKPRYDLTLSFEIDVPFSFFDPYRLGFPKFPGFPQFPRIPPVILPPVPNNCQCSLTDDFNRTVASGLGTSTMGSTWNADAGCSVAAGVATIPNGSFAELTTYSPSTDVSVILTVTGTPSGTSNAGIFGGEANTTGHPTTHDFFELDIYPTGQIELFSRDDDQLVTPGIDFTQPFNCQFLFTASTIDLYMWSVGTSRPTVPTLSISNPNGFRPDYDLYAGNYGTDAAITMASLDAKNMDRCEYPQFDAMHRTIVGPGWGNADTGNPWTGVAGVHGGTAYVHDVQSDAFFPSAGGGIVTDLHLNGLGTALLGQAYTLTTPPPWGNDQSAPAFTLRSRLLVRNVAPSPYTLRFTWAVGGNLGVQFVIVDSGSTVLLNTSFGSDGPVSYNNWGGTDSFSQFMNNVELQYDPTGLGTVNFRIWPDGEERPSSPTLTASMGGDLITGDMLITQAPDEPSGAFLTPTTWTTWWHYFNFFDYAGAPCYPCAPTVFDTFDGRSVSGGWGTASSGATWTRSGSSNGQSVVAAGTGFLQNSTSTTLEVEETDFGLNGVGDFMALVKGALTSDTNVISGSITINGMLVEWIKHSPHNQLVIDDNLGNRLAVDFDDGFWASLNDDAFWRIRRQAGIGSLTVWDQDLPEPVAQVIGPLDTGGYSQDQVSFSSLASGVVGTQDFAIDNIQVSACEPAPVAVFPSGPVFGFIFETPIKIDDTHYQLGRLPQPDTVTVSAGTPQKLLKVTTDFTVDNATGVVTLTNPQTMVTATYVAAGLPLSPGTYTPSNPLVLHGGEVIDGLSFSAAQSNGPDGARTTFIYAEGTAASPVDNITIRNCKFSGGTIAIWLRQCTNVTIQNCIFEDIDYAAIDFWSVIHGSITGNQINRVGYARTNYTDNAFQNNAYGIILNRFESGSLTTDPNTTDILVMGNTVVDVPLWMGINTHGGQDITIIYNTVSGCPRAIFSAGSPFPSGSGTTTRPTNIVVDHNTLQNCVTKAGGTTQKIGILYAGWLGTSIQTNGISTTFTDADVYNFIGDGNGPASGVTVAGNFPIT